jgi:hypothetical protein
MKRDKSWEYSVSFSFPCLYSKQDVTAYSGNMVDIIGVAAYGSWHKNKIHNAITP